MAAKTSGSDGAGVGDCGIGGGLGERIAASLPAAGGSVKPGPLLTVEIAGRRRCGKSILAALLRRLLALHGVAVEGPAELPRRSEAEVLAGIADLARRGLEVRLVETATGEVPVEARLGLPLPALSPADRRALRALGFF